VVSFRRVTKETRTLSSDSWTLTGGGIPPCALTTTSPTAMFSEVMFDDPNQN
jgi:hypothetical protein